MLKCAGVRMELTSSCSSADLVLGLFLCEECACVSVGACYTFKADCRFLSLATGADYY